MFNGLLPWDAYIHVTGLHIICRTLLSVFSIFRQACFQHKSIGCLHARLIGYRYQLQECVSLIMVVGVSARM